MKKYLLWDHDGVLVDTEKWYYQATRECLAELGVQFDQAGYLERMALGLNYWDAARQIGVAEDAIVETRRKRDLRYQEYLLTCDIEIDGVLDVLEQLSGAHQMAIVTTSRREDFELIHRSRRLRHFFEFVITADDCRSHKPAAEPYQRALDRFGAEPSEALAIEDSSRGLCSALAAGLDCVVVQNEFTATQNFSGAWRKIHSIRELPALLCGSATSNVEASSAATEKKRRASCAPSD